MDSGWYPDPDVPGARRYWDGREWSAPLTTAPLTTTEAASAGPGGPAAPTTSTSASRSWVKPFAIVLLVLGAVVLGVGLLLGYSSISAAGVNCGTAFDGISSDAYVAGDLVNIACTDRLASRDTVAKAFVWPGGALLTVSMLSFFVVAAQTSPPEATA